MSKVFLKMPIIFDDVISEKYVSKIEELCVKSPWMYANNITNGEDSIYLQNGFSFSFDENLPQHFLFQYLIFKCSEKINFKVKKILRIRKRLTYPSKEKYNIPYQPHVDFKKKHLVLLYYVNDSDGDTFIYKEKFSKNDANQNLENLCVLDTVNFKKGRVVIFDGSNYHASSLSSSNSRMILNINLSGKFL